VENLRGTTMADTLRQRGVAVDLLVRAGPFHSEADFATIDAAILAGRSTIMFTNDMQAATVIAYLRKTGREPGRDVSITGLDGVTPWAPALGLATVEVPVARVARKAIQLMAKAWRATPRSTSRVPGRTSTGNQPRTHCSRRVRSAQCCLAPALTPYGLVPGRSRDARPGSH